jgi:hypothetical protein
MNSPLPSLASITGDSHAPLRARDSQSPFYYPDDNVFHKAIVEQPRIRDYLATEGALTPLVKRLNLAPAPREMLDPERYLRTMLDQKNPLGEQSSPFVARLTGPVKFLKKLLESWSLSELEVTLMLGLEPSQVGTIRNILHGTLSLRGNDVKERINVLFDIRKTLDALLRDENVERGWLREGKDLLQGSAPMDLILRGSFEDLLLVRDFVFHVAGKL